jgi:uncharacterized membrane protein YraQ (UPF0718 family)
LATLAAVFLGLVIEAVPFLLLGTVFSGLVEAYLNPAQIPRYLPRDPVRSALAGATLGLFFPVGEYGVPPLTRQLLHKGVPLPTAVTFLLAAPVVNLIVLASTLAAFGAGRVLWLRMGLSLLIALTTGLVCAADRHPQRLLRPAARALLAGGGGQPAPAERWAAALTSRQKLRRASIVAADEFFEFGRYLVVGALLAALLQLVIPQPALLALDRGPVSSVAVLSVLAVVQSIGSSGDAFVAQSIAACCRTGAVIAFLVIGPMVDIKNTLMLLAVFRRRMVARLVLMPLTMTLMLAAAINLSALGK